MKATPGKEVINQARCKELGNHRVGPSKCRRSDLTTPSLPADFGREVDAHKHNRPAFMASKNPVFAGKALCRTRTDDPFLTMEVLYQLS